MELIAVPDVPEVGPGDDIAGLVADRVDLEAGDVVVVASTVVSKTEGRTADLADFPAGPRAREVAARIADATGERKDPRFAQAVVEESTELLMSVPFMLCETRFGHVTVNAGIDRSNVPDADLLLLPTDPSESARRVRRGLLERTGIDGECRSRPAATDAESPAPTPTADGAGPASGRDATGLGGETPDGVDGLGVVVSDTSGRPFRTGQRGVAVGWAGLPPTRDWRGEPDRDGRTLAVTVEAVVDELAAAANLVAGEGAGGTPAVVVRDWAFGDHAGGDRLFRDVDSDFVRQALRDWWYDPDRVPDVEERLAPAGADGDREAER
ncbi:coenzyme F420-0:L-glutamate ligase [Halobacteriales archaeon SW_5_70_135]|nr:MAG: coenzyme F420-0:L-glutamate ligase [Halobacteriales archaeon SW_5_70_135]